MPTRKPADVITQGDLMGLRVNREIADRITRYMDALEADYAERIRSGATIEPGPEKFTRRAAAQRGMAQ
jgi:hypothetical protein